MYNKPIKFDGTIIITDPCYIVKVPNYTSIPCWWDYISIHRTEIINGVEHHHLPSPTDYPDCRKKTIKDLEKIKEKDLDYYDSKVRELKKKESQGKPIMFSEKLEKEWELYYKAEREFKENNRDDWEYCDYGERMDLLGFTNYLTDSTIYGDWSCTVFKKNPQRDRKIGRFCADSGMVGVFLLDEVLKYNPEFNYHETKPWTCTVIKDFHGEVMLKLTSKKENRVYSELNMEDDSVTVVGRGNINFVGMQTGL